MTITGDREVERNGEKAAAERTKAVNAAILAIEKQFGSGSIMKLGSAERQSVDSIPTGSIALDLALGVGGIPRGRIIEVFGPEGDRKSTRLNSSHFVPSRMPSSREIGRASCRERVFRTV